MRTKEDTLLKLAEKYEETLPKEYDDVDEKELNRIFASVIKDYGRIYRTCSNEGVDPGEFDAKEFKEEFKVSSAEEKEDLINRVEERITSLIEACDNAPNDIADKYSREKDLVSLFKF